MLKKISKDMVSGETNDEMEIKTCLYPWIDI
jgi:hypothetical protein